MTDCNKPSCNKCSPKTRYCGAMLDCLDVKKGDSYDSIIAKINTLLCGEADGTTYVFEDNDACDNGGIRILENDGVLQTLVYEVCFPCCGTSEGTVLIGKLSNNFDFTTSNDIGSTPYTLLYNTNSQITSTEVTVVDGGDYTLNFDFSAYSTYDLGINYRILVNGTPVAGSVKSVIIDGATPPTNTSTYVLNSVLTNLVPTDKVNIQFRSVTSSGGSPSPGSVYITSATLILNKI